MKMMRKSSKERLLRSLMMYSHQFHVYRRLLVAAAAECKDEPKQASSRSKQAAAKQGSAGNHSTITRLSLDYHSTYRITRGIDM